ncbi:TonB-dependent siderophore receptor [Xylophilus sp. GW821-FHT01B05]
MHRPPLARPRLVALACAAALTAALAQAAPADIDLPAQPLPDAIKALARAAGVSIAADSALLAGKTAPAVRGRLEPADALARLLAGSGLEAMAQPQGGWLLRRAGTERTSTLHEVRVTAKGETADGPVHGYVARRSATATKTDTPIIETPQSISVIGREEMEDRGAQNVMEAMRYTAGIVTESYGLDPRGFDYIKSRGFSTTNSGQYRDGLRLYGSDFALFNAELYGLERLEILRGPSSMLFGQGDAGGVVNWVSKKPTEESRRSAQLQLGNHDRRQLSADLGGALNEDGSLLYRLPIVLRDSHSQYTYSNGARQPDDRVYLAPSLTWKDGARTSVTLLTEFMDDRRGTHFGPYQIPYGESTGVSAGDPAFDRMRQRQSMIGYQLQHTLASDWTFSQSLRYMNNDVDYRALTGYAVQDNSLYRYLYAARQEVSQWAVDNRLEGRVDFAGLQHRLLLGLDSYRVRNRVDTFYSAAIPPVNMLAPVYGQSIDMPSTPSTSTRTKLRQTGIYLQDQIDLGAQWRLTLGLRRDETRQDTYNLIAADQQKQSDQATTYRVGVSYVQNPQLVPYASYSESFLPNTGTGYGGQAFQPSRGRQYEVGMKYAPPQSNALFTIAAFDLRKSNVLTSDSAHACTQVPDDPACGTYQKAEGEVRTRGVELEAKANLRSGLNLVASYTWLDAEITRSADGNAGRRPLDVPRQHAALWLNQRVSALPGLEVGLGARYMGSTYSDSLYLAQVPSYRVFDAALRYRIDPQWNLAVNVSNLADKHYATTCPLGTCYYGPRRTMLATLSYDW